MSSIKHTVKFFLTTEWKSKFAVTSVFIHIFIAVLITYLSLPGLDPALFSTFFWIVVIFTTLQGISKAFIQMHKGHFLYWHQLISPASFLLSRLIANFVLMFAFNLFALLVFIVIHGNPVGDIVLFGVITFVTGTGISSVFTISSSIAAKTDHPGMILPVLTFPMAVPVLLLGMKAGKKAVDGLGWGTTLPEIGLLLLMDIFVAVLGLLLIKFIWKE